MSEIDNNSSGQLDAASLFTSELRQWSESDDISEEGFHQIIRRHRFTQSNILLTDYQFFIAACRNDEVTVGIIRCLLEYFPAAVNEADDDGRLPILYACGRNSNVSLDIIKVLIDSPKSPP